MKRFLIALLAALPTTAAATRYDCSALAVAPQPAEGAVAARVRLQHHLLELAPRVPAGAPRGVVLAVARELAPSDDELASLGDPEQPRVAAVLGPMAFVVQRATATCGTGNSIHNIYNHGLLAFRPLRAGTTRALVAQLVAFDGEGHPHETPLVDAIELRVGDTAAAPACVVEAGSDGVLHATPLAELDARPPFVMRAGDGIGCSNCHSGNNTMNARDIAGDELARVDALRTRQIEQLGEGFWQSIAR